MSILLSIIVYMVAVILGCTFYIRKKAKHEVARQDDFMLGGRNLSVAVVGVTIALTGLGAVHVFGLMELGFMMGAMATWFIIAQGILMVVVCLVTGEWLRRYNFATMGEFMSKIFGPRMQAVVACATAGVVWGFMTLEAQGLGIVFKAFTGWPMTYGIALGALFSVLYVVLAGVKEIGYANTVNTVVMYFGVVMCIVLLGMAFSSDLGWESVNRFYIDTDQQWMLSIFGKPTIVYTFGLSMVVAIVFSQSVNQNLLHVAASAKSADTVRKAVWIVVPVNVIFGGFTIAMGMAAKSIPEFAALGPKLGATKMLIEFLPNWALAVLLASFVAAIVSSFAMEAMAVASIFNRDIFVSRYKPDATEKEQTRIIRICIILLAITATIMATFLPTIVGAVSWLSSYWRTRSSLSRVSRSSKQ